MIDYLGKHLFTMAFPLSYFLFIIGLIIGIVISLTFFSILTCVCILVLIYTNILDITPIIDLFHRIIIAVVPDIYSKTLENIRESFQVEKTTDTQPQKAIYTFHPHGIFSMGLGFHIGSKLTGWDIENVKAVLLEGLFFIPFTKQIVKNILNSRVIPSTYSVMKATLDEGTSIALCIGGLKEIAYTQPGVIKTSILTRRGIFKMAIQTGTPLVPVITYGENELYDIYRSPWLDTLQKYTMICFPRVSSILQWISIIHRPLKNPLRTVIGAPIPVGEAREPTAEEIIALRTKYIEQLRKLYADTKPENYQEELEVV